MGFTAALMLSLAVPARAESAVELARHIDQLASREPGALAADVRLQAAGTVRGTDAEMARRLVDEAAKDAPPKVYPALLMMLAGTDKASGLQLFNSIPFEHPGAEWDRWLLLACVISMSQGDSGAASAALQKIPLGEDGSFRRAVGAVLHSIDAPAYTRRSDLMAADITALSTEDAIKLAWSLYGARMNGSTGARPQPDGAQEFMSRLKGLRGDISESQRA